MENSNTNPVETFEKARAAVYAGEAAGLSARTMGKRWAAYFRAEDALKAHAGGWR